MNEITFPTLPTSTLIKASVIALLTASLIFITVILPVEYNIDPTGSGKLLGLTVLAANNSEVTTEQANKETVAAAQDNVVTVVVPAHKGVEYKFKMQQYAKLTYEWTTDGTPLFFDFHGEPKGDTTGYFESYVLATNAQMKGSMTMPFDGVHGWYWKNKSDKEVIVTLKTQGEYEIVGLIH